MAIIGIDLGTTNSACGVMRGENIELIPNRLGELLTPSVVGFDDNDKLLVGRTAKERLISHADKTVAVFKRLVGTDHRIKIGKKEFTATELSSLVLRSIKEDAEEYLGEPITDAVISVPAYFNDNQRLATKQAGELAGLKVDRLINEPTAAAMAYGLQEKEEGTFIVLDMGGGTFDVSILEFFEGVMEVHASAGDNFLGGEDFVDAMVNDVLAQHQIERSELSKQQVNTLFMQMETLKRKIDTQIGQTLSLQLGNKSHDWVISADWFTGICTPLLLRAKQPIERAIRDADIALADIEDIILVGGSTRLKMFRNNIGRLFGRIPSSTIDPDIVVAQGAAVQAALIEKNQALNDLVLTDVCPYTLGTEVNGPDGHGGGYFLPIIERNSVVPISVVRTLQTASDDQTTVEVNIYQGENRLTQKNVFLGTISASVPKGPAGKEMLDVRYSYDMNGLLEVDITICSTGKLVNKVIENNPGSLSEKDLLASKKRLSALKFHPREQEENSVLLAKGERMFESTLGEKREYIAALLAEFEKVLDGQQPLEIKKARLQLAEILTDLDSEDWI